MPRLSAILVLSAISSRKTQFAWVFTYIFYLPWVFIGNIGLKSYGEWAQKKYEKDMDELESME